MIIFNILFHSFVHIYLLHVVCFILHVYTLVFYATVKSDGDDFSKTYLRILCPFQMEITAWSQPLKTAPYD